MPLTPDEQLELEQLQAELIQKESAPEFTIPIEPTQIPQTPQFQMPQSMLQERLTPERALSATIAGQLGGVRTLTEGVDIATAAPELEQRLMQEQIKAGIKPTPLPKGMQIVGETFEQVPVIGSELRKGLEFKAATPAEQALEVFSGLAPLALNLSKSANIARVAKQRVQQFEALDDIARVSQKHNAIPPEFTVASEKVREFAASEVLAASKEPGAKLKQFYNAIGKKFPEVVYGKEAAKQAKILDTKLTRIEGKIGQAQDEVVQLAEQADVIGASAPLRSANKTRTSLKINFQA